MTTSNQKTVSMEYSIERLKVLSMHIKGTMDYHEEYTRPLDDIIDELTRNK